jgi:hypothetical protein
MGRESTVLDAMRVPVTGDPLVALVEVDHDAPARGVECEVLVVGGGMGGVSAALAAARRGKKVCLVEETDWLGGQITSQGVSALDEHEHIEDFGGTRSYYELRESIRDHYRALPSERDLSGPFSPGTSWVSRIAFEPRVALQVIDGFLSPFVETGQVQIFLRAKAVEAIVEDDRVTSLKTINLDDGSYTRFSFDYLLDATELGDLLPLTGTEYVSGAESVAETGEPHAQPERGMSHCVQSCTYTFVMERRPDGEDNRIAKPDKYDEYRKSQPYSLRIHVHGGEIYGEESGWLDYHVFEERPGTKGPLWKYRRLVEAAQFPDNYENDVTVFNWPGNDYRDVPLTDQTPEQLAKALQDAKRVSLGFAHWLQSEADDGGHANIRLRPDVMGSPDGLSKYPYIRESRRIKAIKTVVEQDVAVAHNPGERATHFDDSVGIGWYPIDIHQAGADDVGTSTRTKPFQIPLGALIPVRMRNLIAANKNIGTTHITNGCYRLHPVEWNIGEAAGTLAAFCIGTGQTPKTVHSDTDMLRVFQRDLLSDGVPLTWLIDVPVWSPDFMATQRLAMSRIFDDGESLDFGPEQLISADERALWIRRVEGSDATDPCGDGPTTRARFAAMMADAGRT